MKINPILDVPTVFGGAELDYDQYILINYGTNLLSLLPLTELAGSTAADASGNSRTGAYGAGVTLNGITFLNGDPAPIIGTGATCYINWFTPSLRDAINGQEITVAGWAKAAALTHWTDSTTQRLFYMIAHPDYVVGPQSLSVPNNRMFAQYIAGGTTENFSFEGMYTTSWFHWAITASKANERARLYVNGEIVLATTALGSWSTTPTGIVLGATNTSGTNAWGANNAMAYCGIWARELSATDIDGLYSRLLTDRQITSVGDSKTYNDSWLYFVAQRLFDVSGQSYRQINKNFGIDGANAATMAAYVTANIASATGNPQYILFNIGANDLTGLPAEATWKANIITCIDAFLAKWPATTVYIAKPWRRTYGTEANTMAGWIDAIVALYGSNVLVGHDERTWLENGDDGVTYTSDGVHYNLAGNLACTAAILTVLGY